MLEKAPRFWRRIRLGLGILSISSLFFAFTTEALELDWSGQFWSEFNFVNNYTMDSSSAGSNTDPARMDGTIPKGYYIPGGGNNEASFFSLFLRIRPKVIVNDNVYIKSEWWLGDPVYGLFGSGLPYQTDQRQYYTSFSRGSSISAQRFWGEFVSDIGTFQIGRVPLQWGLGIVWNSGDNLWDRYLSTGDAVRWLAKFGSFSFVPSIIINSIGNTIGGACTVNANGTGCDTTGKSGGVSDYSLLLKYENTDDELEGGINLIKRIGGSSQDPGAGVLTPGGNQQLPTGMNFTTYDLYAKKKFSRFSLGAEVPIISGSLGSTDFQSVGFAAEADWKPTDNYGLLLKTGFAPGQASSFGSNIDTYRTFYFHPNYHIGMIMFNYQLANFARPQTLNNSALSPAALGSPYDNPIVNAFYAALSTQLKPWDKWSFRPAFIFARAPQTAKTGQYFYNYRTHRVENNVSGKDQSSDLGWEFDLGVNFQWDENFQFTWDNGLYFPGQFFAFSNSAVDNATNMVFATSFRVGVNF